MNAVLEPKTYTIGPSHSLDPAVFDPRERDSRGLVWIFEEPRPNATYVLGCDPTVGITNWSRFSRKVDDYRIDNGAIEVLRVGNVGLNIPDVQVAEFAAPIDPEDLADYVHALGTLYAGASDSNQALAIIEVWPGPGLLTQRRLINHFGYVNLFVWETIDSMAVRQTSSLGWTSTPKSVRDLSIRSMRHISKRLVKIASPWLVEELTDCEMDQTKMVAKAAYGAHDDRWRAFAMALWAAHDWTFQADIPDASSVREGPRARNWQASDCSLEEMYEEWDELFDQLMN